MLYRTSFRQNLISISVLDKSCYSCLQENEKFSFFQYSNLIGTSSLINNDNLYLLYTITSHNEILHSTKRKSSEDSPMLWHKCLGHISKQRIERLVSDGILPSLDLADFQVCIECIKRKQTNVTRLGANRYSDVLKLIHTDICGPFPTASWNGQHYFIMFIDDYSCYGYLYLIHEKSQAMDVFK